MISEEWQTLRIKVDIYTTVFDVSIKINICLSNIMLFETGREVISKGIHNESNGIGKHISVDGQSCWEKVNSNSTQAL